MIRTCHRHPTDRVLRAARLAIALACLCRFSANAFAQRNDAPPRNADQNAAVAVDLAGKAHEGTVVSLRNGVLTLNNGGSVELRQSELISLRFPARRRAAAFPRSMVFLDNGDRLALEPERVDGETIGGHWRSLVGAPTVAVPLETVRGLFLNAAEVESVQQRSFRELLDRRESSDVLVLANGDRLAGELKGIDDKAVTIENAAGAARIERGQVEWIGCNQDLISFPDAGRARGVLALADGSRITVRSIEISTEGTARFEPLFGGAVEVAASSLASMLFFSDRVEFLSDREPAEYSFTPFLGTRWPLRRDRSVEGGLLLLRGTEHLKGLGMHSQSRVHYRLDGAYRQFRSLAGIDDAARGGGSAVFAVEVDGRRVFQSDELTGRSPPAVVGPIDLTGARELILEVEFGRSGDVLDRADWCDAYLLK